MAKKGTKQGNDSTSASGSKPGGDAVYALGVIGAWVYFWKQADTPRGRGLGLLKGMVWPAFLVYEALSAVGGRPGTTSSAAPSD